MATIFSHKEQGLSISRTLTQAPEALPYRLHNHNTLEIYCFLRGRGVFHIEGTAYSLEPGDVLIMAPSESHYIQLEAQPYERIVLNVSEDYLEALDPSGWLLTPFRRRIPGTHNRYRAEDFPGGSLALFDTMLSPEGNTHVNVLMGMLPLLDRICQLWQAHTAQEDTPGEATGHSIIRYINRNLPTPLSLDGLCKQFYISKSQLCRLFKKATGTTVWNYITLKRLALADRLLQSGESATHVFTQCGFSDYSTFYRAYTKVYHHAPGRR